MRAKQKTSKNRAEECWSILDTIVSGSPLIQNGKLIGAVTHVLVNDPTRGYGIFIENMLETANQVEEEQAKKDAEARKKARQAEAQKRKDAWNTLLGK